MAFKIFRNDITKVCADAIVNTANPFPIIGRGTDFSVYNAAGVDELLEARKKIGFIKSGNSACTSAFNLEKNGVKYIIHSVGILYQDGNSGETEILRNCYKSALQIALEKKCKSVAIPLLSSGNYNFPKELALQIAIEEISRFLFENEIEIFLVVYDDESYKISEKLFNDVEDFLNEENLKLKNSDVNTKIEKEIILKDLDFFINTSKNKLNFQNTLQKLIADRKLNNATIYKKAGIDKKFFSKIISNKDYVPKKHTVMALGLALELSLSEYEHFLASAGYAFMPSSRFDLIIKYCVMNQIYNLINVDVILNDHGEECFSPK